MHYYQLSPEEVTKKLKVDFSYGLSLKEAQKRLLKFGPNIFKRKKTRPASFIFFSQFANFLILLLLLAFLISLFALKISHTLVLALVILLNVLMGFILEYKAEKALESLKKIFIPKAVVRREGKEKIISAWDLTPGDIVLINQGDRIPADLRLFETSQLEIDESILTGESIPSRKFSQSLPLKTPLADQENMAFCGTLVVNGQGKGIVVATSSETELGKIAALVQEEVEKTPLQERLNYLAKILAIFSLGLVLIIFLLGFLKGRALLDLFNYALALLVSAVPESLPTIITLALAIGVIKMAKNKAIVRKLPALETLASVNIICVDKTGTLTKGEMTVKKIWLPNLGEIEIEGTGYLPEPKIDLKKEAGLAAVALAKAGYLCNKAILNFDKEKEKWQIIGDPTEGALLVLGEKASIGKELKDHEKIHEILFEEKRRLMSVVFRQKGKIFVYTKGAPESVLKISKINPEERKKTEREIEKLTKEGYRVLGLAIKKLRKKTRLTEKEIEKDLIFLGLVGLIDPPDEQAKEAISLCQTAQIKPVIISGDHKLTTVACARQLGLKIKEENVLTGEELEELTSEKLAKIIDKIIVFARTSPLQKTKILSAFKKKGYIVAMTGDGINDAPVLKKADLGIAMGERGQDVAKEASDIILTDDKFSTIEKAIEYARTIYDNIEKFITYLLSGNYIELSLVSLAFLFGFPLPLSPLQILWINLITEGGPALALAAEKPETEIMKETPKNPKKTIIFSSLSRAFLFASLGILISFALFLKYLKISHILAQTMVFIFIAFFEIIIIFSLRQRDPFWAGAQKLRQRFFSNRYLILAIFISILFLLLALYTPLSNPIGTIPLDLSHWAVILVLGFVCFLILEISKLFRQKKLKVTK